MHNLSNLCHFDTFGIFEKKKSLKIIIHRRRSHHITARSDISVTLDDLLLHYSVKKTNKIAFGYKHIYLTYGHLFLPIMSYGEFQIQKKTRPSVHSSLPPGTMEPCAENHMHQSI